MTPLKTPVEKLPLTDRKNIRDEWDARKPGYEAKVKELCGEPWTFDWNPLLIFQYANEWRGRLGEVMALYTNAFIENLQLFNTRFGADGIEELNAICSKHQVVLSPQEKTDFAYGGLVADDGVLRIVFAEDKLVVNIGDVTRDIEEALKAVSKGALNIVARQAIREDYDPEIDKVHSAISSMVNVPGLRLNPNFEANAAELVKSQSHVEERWERNFGRATLTYFLSLQEVLEREKFKGDDMQQEAFQEAVTKKEVCVRVLPKWEDGESRYNEVKIEDGVLYIQTMTEKWAVNIYDAATGLMNLL